MAMVSAYFVFGLLIGLAIGVLSGIAACALDVKLNSMYPPPRRRNKTK